MIPSNFIRLSAKPPTVKLPPSNAIILYFDATTGAIVGKDSSGDAVYFSSEEGAGGEGKANLTGGNSFTGNQTVNGSVEAGSFITDGPSVFNSGAEWTYNSTTADTHLLALGAGQRIPRVPGFADLTAANLALASGDYWWDTTLGKLRIATA